MLRRLVRSLFVQPIKLCHMVNRFSSLPPNSTSSQVEEKWIGRFEKLPQCKDKQDKIAVIPIVKILLPLSTSDFDLFKSLSHVPVKLFHKSVEKWKTVSTTLVEECFDVKTMVEMIVTSPSLLDQSSTSLSKMLNQYAAAKFSREDLKILFTECPDFFDIPFNEVRDTLAVMSPYYPPYGIARMAAAEPIILKLDPELMTEKIGYLHHTVFAKTSDVLRTKCLSYSLEMIKTRFDFLLDLGMYTLPDPKKFVHLNNPDLYDIVETTDNKFAKRGAKATLEEFLVFEELTTRKREEGEDDEVWDKHLPARHRLDYCHDI